MEWTTVILFMFAMSLLVWYFLYYHYIKPYSYFDKLKIPGPMPNFIVGNLLDTSYGHRHLAITSYARKYGKIFGLYYGKIPIIHVADPDIAQEILSKQADNFINRIPLGSSARKSVGLFEARGNVWRHARESLSPLFSPNKLKLMSKFANKTSKNLLDDFLSRCKRGDNVINAKKYFYAALMDMSLASFFGIKENEKRKGDLQRHINNFMTGFTKPIAVLSISLPKIYRWLSLFIAFKQVIGIFTASRMLRRIVEKRHQELDENRPTNNDMLKLVFEAQYKEKISDRDIVQHCLTFLIGGYDTTASSLTFVTSALAANPEIQDKLIDEIDRYCSDETCLTYNHMQKLTYMDQIFHETMRYYSPGYINLREAKEDCTIKGVRIPKGVGIAIAVIAIHHDPEIWENPDKFDPERFSPDAKANRHPYHYIPFSQGPRKCIGSRLGIMNIKLILTRLLQHVKFEMTEDTEIPMPTVAIFTLIPEKPVYLKIVPRA